MLLVSIWIESKNSSIKPNQGGICIFIWTSKRQVRGTVFVVILLYYCIVQGKMWPKADFLIWQVIPVHNSTHWFLVWNHLSCILTRTKKSIQLIFSGCTICATWNAYMEQTMSRFLRVPVLCAHVIHVHVHMHTQLSSFWCEHLAV